ncbi:glycosyltransferase family 39 protein [Pseudomonas sp. 10S4]|uniref:glycosyltransferase family 39 protein n=1 Tax=Pseudomonas sp. 10S4 TaxID=3048583 RepID=UPI002AC9B843|nr:MULTISPECIES: glycosyltransferase family 39 protein [unclassified Pseudomonas]MEB0224183.1 glycosyltransferase family 39 protein [Pseudomonas sp. 5S1]MEB0294560.1 glycosyltransferase family 39 protein [Pseudomonas sp. 10S4]WPX18907.1 glycosyltransferase family 39 protein [Pseudomonas sp. 10S4]
MKYFAAYRVEHPGFLLEASGLVAIVILALIVRFHGIAVPSVWYDEAFSLLISKEEPVQIWAITAWDVHPPLYYILLHYWLMIFGDNAVSARSLSVVADVVTLLLCIKLMSLFTTRKAMWMAALLLALLPMSVRYSQEIRMYALLGFWLMGATVALVCWCQAPDRTRFAIIYVLLMTAAFYTHYFAALCVMVHWLYWWQSRSISGAGLAARSWILANAAIVVLFVPWLPYVIDQLRAGPSLGWIPPATWQSILTIVWQFMVMKGPVTDSSFWGVLSTVLIIICSARILLKDRIKPRFSVLLVGYFFVPVLTVFLVALFKPIFVPRYLGFAAVGLPLIIATALASWWPVRRALVIGLMAFFLIGEIQGVSAIYGQTDDLNGSSVRKTMGLEGVAAHISRDARPGDEIVFDSFFWYLPFMYYNTTGIQPRFYIRSAQEMLTLLSPGHGALALIPQRSKWMFFHDVAVLKQGERRVWWVTDLPHSADEELFGKDWRYVQGFKDRKIEARLYVLDSTATPTEDGVQEGLTQQQPHSAQNYPPAPSATSASKTRHSLPR